MKHRVYGKHLGRDKDQREALFKSLVQSLILHGTIETSLKKANAVKGLVDRLINQAKEKNRHHLLQNYLTNKDLRERLVKEIAPKVGSRNSGYTSVIKLGTRYGDNTMMVRMSIIGAEKLGPLQKVTGNRVQNAVKKTEEVKKSAPQKKVSPRRTVRKVVTKKVTAPRKKK